jgi:hypothetical protein
MKLYKNSFLKFIFVNLIIVNIRSINDNEVENNELFTCPQGNNYKEMDHHARCMRIKELYLLIKKFDSLKEKKRDDLENYSDAKARLERNLKFSCWRQDPFLKWIEKNANEKTKQFFMVLKENKKGQETKRE